MRRNANEEEIKSFKDLVDGGHAPSKGIGFSIFGAGGGLPEAGTKIVIAAGTFPEAYVPEGSSEISYQYATNLSGIKLSKGTLFGKHYANAAGDYKMSSEDFKSRTTIKNLAASFDMVVITLPNQKAFSVPVPNRNIELTVATVEKTYLPRAGRTTDDNKPLCWDAQGKVMHVDRLVNDYKVLREE